MPVAILEAGELGYCYLAFSFPHICSALIINFDCENFKAQQDLYAVRLLMFSFQFNIEYFYRILILLKVGLAEWCGMGELFTDSKSFSPTSLANHSPCILFLLYSMMLQKKSRDWSQKTWIFISNLCRVLVVWTWASYTHFEPRFLTCKMGTDIFPFKLPWGLNDRICKTLPSAYLIKGIWWILTLFSPIFSI